MSKDRLKSLLFNENRDQKWCENLQRVLKQKPLNVKELISFVAYHYQRDKSLIDGYSRLANYLIETSTDRESPKELFILDKAENRQSWFQKLRHIEYLTPKIKSEGATKLIKQVYEQHPKAVNGFASIAWKYRNSPELINSPFKFAKKDFDFQRLTPGFMLNFAVLTADVGKINLAFSIVEKAYKSDPLIKDGYSRCSWAYHLQDTNYHKITEAIEKDYLEDRLSSCWLPKLLLLYTATTQMQKADSLSKSINNLQVRINSIDIIIFLLHTNYLNKKLSNHLNLFKVVLSNTCADKYTDLLKLLIDEKWYEAEKNLMQLAHKNDLLSKVYLYALQAQGKINLIQDFHQKKGIECLKNDNIFGALKNFSECESAYKQRGNISKFLDHPKINNAINSYAHKHFIPIEGESRHSNNKSKILFLLNSTEDTAVSQIMLQYLKYVSDDKYELKVVFTRPSFAPYPNSEIVNIIREKNLELISSYTNDFHIENTNEWFSILAKSIHLFNPDLLITSTYNAFQRFARAMAPSSKVINLIFGDFPCFCQSSSDAGIVFFNSMLKGAPCPVFKSKIPTILPDIKSLKKLSRRELKIFKNTITLISAGRPEKYTSLLYWEHILETLSSLPESGLIIIGCEWHQIAPEIQKIIPASIKDRIQFLKRKKNYLEYICEAHVYIDSFPEGGGITVCAAMALALPVISFHTPNDRYIPFYERNLAAEFGLPAPLLISLNEKQSLKNKVFDLVKNSDFCKEMSNLCKEIIWANYGTPEKAVKESEEIWLDFIK